MTTKKQTKKAPKTSAKSAPRRKKPAQTPVSEAPQKVDWSKPQVVSKVQQVFPANVVGKLLPLMEELPPGFDYHNYSEEGRRWAHLVSSLFYGYFKNPGFIMKDGIDGQTAFTHLTTCLRSYQPKHEHKEAGCAYLASLWFKDIIEQAVEAKADAPK